MWLLCTGRSNSQGQSLYPRYVSEREVTSFRGCQLLFDNRATAVDAISCPSQSKLIAIAKQSFCWS